MDQAQANWETLRESTKRRWTELADDDLNEITNYSQLVKMLQLRYGYTFERASLEIDEMVKDFAMRSQPTPG